MPVATAPGLSTPERLDRPDWRSSMRVLLVKPPYVGWLSDVRVEPLGLLCIGSYLRKHGHEVVLYGPYIGERESDFESPVQEGKPTVVGCAVSTTVSEEFCFDLARKTKQRRTTVALAQGLWWRAACPAW